MLFRASDPAPQMTSPAASPNTNPALSLRTKPNQNRSGAREATKERARCFPEASKLQTSGGFCTEQGHPEFFEVPQVKTSLTRNAEAALLAIAQHPQARQALVPLYSHQFQALLLPFCPFLICAVGLLRTGNSIQRIRCCPSAIHRHRKNRRTHHRAVSLHFLSLPALR